MIIQPVAHITLWTEERRFQFGRQEGTAGKAPQTHMPPMTPQGGATADSASFFFSEDVSGLRSGYQPPPDRDTTGMLIGWPCVAALRVRCKSSCSLVYLRWRGGTQGSGGQRCRGRPRWGVSCGNVGCAYVEKGAAMFFQAPGGGREPRAKWSASCRPGGRLPARLRCRRSRRRPSLIHWQQRSRVHCSDSVQK